MGGMRLSFDARECPLRIRQVLGSASLAAGACECYVHRGLLPGTDPHPVHPPRGRYRSPAVTHTQRRGLCEASRDLLGATSSHPPLSGGCARQAHQGCAGVAGAVASNRSHEAEKFSPRSGLPRPPPCGRPGRRSRSQQSGPVPFACTRHRCPIPGTDPLPVHPLPTGAIDRRPTQTPSAGDCARPRGTC